MKLIIEFKKNEHTGRADIVLPDGIWRGTSMPWDEAEEYAAAMAPQDGLREALERLQAIIDWADFALANPAEFNRSGVRNLDGPVFDEARKLLAATPAAQQAAPEEV